MTRAGIFIGVDQTGQLQRLNDAAAGARRMHTWALAQGMADGTHAKLITDEGGQKVTPDMIFDAIADILNGPGVDQLLVYFAGHGVNKNRSEHWLLSDAPTKTSAAVNVAGSVDQARYAGIPYVVFISDACRVAPEGIQAQRVNGVEVFPNDDASDRARPVDQFFACMLGRTAAEIKDPAEAAAGFSALYTSTLLDALEGKIPGVLTAGTPPDTGHYVKPARLRDELEREIPRRLIARGLATRVNQTPDAIVLDHAHWLSRIDVLPPVDAGRPGPDPALPSIPPGPPAPAPAPPPMAGALPPPPPVDEPTPAAATPHAIARDLVRVATTESSDALAAALENARTAAAPAANEMAETASRVAAPFGPEHHETHCGIKVRGRRIVEFHIVEGGAEIADGIGMDLRVFPTVRPASVWLRFEGDVGTVVPVIQGFLTALTFDEGELVDVALEPSALHSRYDAYGERLPELRTLRAVVAAASRQGRFRLDGPEALALAQRMQVAKSVDPALALYAAYAYHDLQELDRLRGMSNYLADDLGTRLFDVAMLARQILDTPVDRDARVVPFVPMLSQGWALLRAHRVRLHPSLDGLERHVCESLWSLYDLNGLALLRDALQSREVW